jgi:hypothetical protein
MRKPARLVTLLTSVLSLAALACSSSSSSGQVDSGFGFGGGDSSTKDAHTEKQKDTGTTSPMKDAGSTAPSGDAACGSSGGSDWCTKNAPMLTSSSSLFCDDFDEGVLSSDFNWPGVRASDLVNAHYVSPYCALRAALEAGSPQKGAYSEHPYTLAPATAGATLAFDLFVPGGSSCEGVVVSRFYATVAQSGTNADAINVWLTLSGIQGSGTSATSYTVSMRALVGDSGDGGVPGTVTAPATLTVTPRTSDRGWARLAIDLSSYAIATPATVAGKFTWGYAGEAAAKATSSSISASGQLGTPLGNDTQLEFDVGVVPDPSGPGVVTGCQLYVDDFVSNVIPN